MIPGPIPHGGDLTAAEARFGRPEGGWMDLSTGINPWPYPFVFPNNISWRRLPDSGIVERLLGAAAAAYGVPDPACVVAAPGTQAVIQWLPRLRAPGTVAVLAPTYAEHAAAWSAAGHAVRTVAGFEDADADVVVVTNPNNPDGRVVAPERLLAIVAAQAARGGWLVVDEAFVDPTPRLSLAAACDRPGLVLLRSFGKFFGLAGARLGFALAAPALALEMRSALGPWCVGGPTATIGAAALEDGGWIASMRERLAGAAADLDAVLEAGGLTVLGGTTLFRLAEHRDAPALFERLARAGVLARPFPEHPSWLRFGLPPDARAVERLRAALA